jgi:hypothetical protein
MIWGYNTLASVALRLIEDYKDFSMRHDTGFTLDQAIQRVCHNGKTLAAWKESPSYVWWRFGINHGELAIDVDRGCLTEAHFPVIKGDRGYVACQDMDTDCVIPQNYLPENHYIHSGELEAVALRMGLGLGQNVLTRFVENWSTDYWGESDSQRHIEILYAQEGGPFGMFVHPEMSPTPRMTGFRLA